MPFVALRYANVYGPRQDPHGEAGVVAIFSGKMLAGRADHRERRRQADARLRLRRRRGAQNLLALEREATGPVNIGTGVETDVNQLAGTLLEVAGQPHPRCGTARRSPASSGAAWSTSGAPPRCSAGVPRCRCATGLARTVEFFRARAAG